jgi:hypothetical protein
MITSDAPPAVVGVGVLTEPDVLLDWVRVPATLAAPNAFAICCATVRPALEEYVYVTGL